MQWKEFFYYSQSERRGIGVLIVLIVFVGAFSHFISSREASVDTDETFEKEYAAFIDSLQERKQTSERNRSPHFQSRPILLAPFDPNTTDSVGFLNLGLPSWMARNILRYRTKGGIFRRPEEFKKVYGLTEKQYSTLLPYLFIDERFSQSHKDTFRLYTQQPRRDSTIQFKYPIGTVLNLNRVDTTELKKIPGVGSGIARMIVAHRRSLGGFYRIEQLGEIHLRVDSLRRWLSVGSHETQRINLNRVSVERLSAHPYFNFYQAKVIVEYRKKRGAWKNLQELKLFEEFTPQDLERIAPYVCFE